MEEVNLNHYLFLHGLGQNADSWKDAIPTVDKAHCPNLSNFITPNESTYQSLYAEFSAYCKMFPQPIHLCGLSLGGVLALQYATEYPDQVASLAIIGAQYQMPKNLLKLQNIMFHVLPKRAFRGIGLCKRDVISLTDSMVNLDFTQEMSRITCPTLVLCGEKDFINEKAAKSMAECIVHAQLQMVKGSGHEVNVDCPEYLRELLAAFYRESENCP